MHRHGPLSNPRLTHRPQPSAQRVRDGDVRPVVVRLPPDAQAAAKAGEVGGELQDNGVAGVGWRGGGGVWV